jgi:cytochrome c biogenesis protein CcmG/thiol:disulfide interchange protein DsbE
MEIKGVHDALSVNENVLPREADADEAKAALRKRSRKRNITIVVVVSLLNVGLLALLWTQLITPSQQANTNASTTYGDYHAPLIGKQAPDFSLPVFTSAGETSKTLRLSDFKGKNVVLNFWASWCDACQSEAPYLQKTAFPKLQTQGITLIGIDAPENAGMSQNFLLKYGIAYPNVEDTLNGATAINYGVSTFPMTVFINSKGMVTGMWNTEMTGQGLQLELSKLKS